MVRTYAAIDHLTCSLLLCRLSQVVSSKYDYFCLQFLRFIENTVLKKGVCKYRAGHIDLLKFDFSVFKTYFYPACRPE